MPLSSKVRSHVDLELEHQILTMNLLRYLIKLLTGVMVCGANLLANDRSTLPPIVFRAGPDAAAQAALWENYTPPVVSISSRPQPEEWQLLPSGLLYHSYLAGEKEPRFQFVPLADKGRGMIWETSLGGRAGLLRYGTTDASRPEGWQLDLEGSAQPRIDPEQNDDLTATDFRAGILSTWRFGPQAWKAGYYHISSHLGDEFLIKNPGFQRVNYVRDSLIAGYTYDLTGDLQAYFEGAYAFNAEGGAKPLEFQLGTQYSPLKSTLIRGAPFAAWNAHTRQDFNFTTGVNLVAGWQWRGSESGHLFRTGLQYYKGPSLQYSFVRRQETLLGGGLWFDF